MTKHACGGTIISGHDYDYCNRCEAFAHDGKPIPDGRNRAANLKALVTGDIASPAATPIYECRCSHLSLMGPPRWCPGCTGPTTFAEIFNG